MMVGPHKFLGRTTKIEGLNLNDEVGYGRFFKDMNPTVVSMQKMRCARNALNYCTRVGIKNGKKKNLIRTLCKGPQHILLEVVYPSRVWKKYFK